MKVAHFSTHDITGGAARAAHRLHVALTRRNCDSRFFVLHKRGDDPLTERAIRSTWWNEARQEITAAAQNALLYYHHPDETFSFDNTLLSTPTSELVARTQGSQIINLHWTRGLITSAQARLLARKTGAPIVWTLMDLAPITGGCHYPQDCLGYHASCGQCPRLRSTRPYDRSRSIWRKRKRNYAATPLTLVACNTWTAARVRESSLLNNVRCEVIPLAIDVDVFRPLPQHIAREVLRVPPKHRVILCGALHMAQKRKGFALLMEALRLLKDYLDQQRIIEQPILILLAGGHDFAPAAELPFESMHLGMMGDDRSLALAYSASDVFVSPSIQDAGPMMVNESLSCGVPVVAFEIGSAPDFVRPGETGWLARPGDADGLARGLAHVLDFPEPQRLRDLSRETAVSAYAQDRVAARYLDLYRDLVG